MKKIFTIILLLVSLGLSAQSYNNEWIDYSKTYYKFKVGATGLYRIPQSILSGAGLGSVPSQNFQLFRNGQEVPLYTSVNGTFGSNDYIEFWGQINDGAADRPLYRSPTYQHSQQISLETDTAIYFLTVNPTGATFHSFGTTNDVAGNTLPVEPYLLYKAATYFKTTINPGFSQKVGEDIYSSSYDIGEFWSTGFIAPGSPFTNTQNGLFVYTSGPDANIRFGLVGDADNLRTIRMSVNGSVLCDTTMNSHADLLTNRAVPLTLLSSNSAAVTFTNNSAEPTDRMVSSFYELTYPRQFNFAGASNFVFDLPAKSSGYFLNISNFNISGSATPVLYDLTNGLRYTAVVGGGILSFALGGSTASRHLALVNEDPSTVTNVTGLTAKNFLNLTNTANQGNYIIISNPLLYTGSSGNNPVADFKAYRSSAAGGSFNAQMYDINELQDQFAFGIKKNPLAVQNFLRYARNSFAGKPQFVFLIGHGLTYVDYNFYSEVNHDPLADVLDMIPPFGFPASDNKLSADNAVDAVPVTPIGRLSVVSGPEIENYLNKLKDYEQVQLSSPNTIDGRLWMKNAVHLTGVSEPYLGSILCNYVTSYQLLLQDTLVGANVYTFCDGNAANVSQAPATVISGLFNTGFGMLNYFGHSSNATLSYNLDNPQDYNNFKKYPVFFVNGCDAGDFFIYDNQRTGVSLTLSEAYVLAKDRGSIAFVASTHFGIVTYLNILLYGLYTLMDGTDYAKPLGILQKDALQLLVNAAPGDYFARLHAEEMTTHGDPFLKLNQGNTDYDIEASQIQINPSFISVNANNFEVKARFYNLGKAVRDSIFVKVSRTYPNGTTDVLLLKKIRGIDYSDSIDIFVPIIANRDKGQNTITVSINPGAVVPEVTYINNSASASVFIYQDGATPVYPYNYAIINTPTSKLIASTSNPISPSLQYVMEVDTTGAFNSSIKVSKFLTSIGGDLEFDPGISYTDSLVYYWRVSPVPQAGSQYTWSNASFVYIDPAHSGVGFNQSHYYQHLQSTASSIALDSVSRIWKYPSHLDNLYVRNTTFPVGAGGSTDDGYSTSVNGGQFDVGPGCAYNEMIITVFDSVTLKPMPNDYSSGSSGLFGSMLSTCGPNRGYNFEYSLGDPASRKKAMDFLNMLPTGVFVEVRNNVNPDSSSNTYVDTWKTDAALYGGNSLYTIFQSQGISVAVDSFTKPRAFGFVYQKGLTTFTPRYGITAGVLDAIAVSIDIPMPDTLGSVLSPLFGPSKKWQKVHWRGGSLRSPFTDSTVVQVIGVDTLGALTVLYNLNRSTQDFDLSAVSAKQYPFLRLNLITADSKHAAPFQLNYWRIEDQPVPEGALVPNIFLKAKDTLNLGEQLDFAIAFKNVSPYAFDSLRIQLNIIDHNNVTHVIPLPRRKPLISGDTVTLEYFIDTKQFPGANTIYLNFNPSNDQPEQYLFNNFLYKGFYVRSDTRSPNLDVTFDNIHILNDDIVSARPHIQIKLQSQSQYLLLADTSLLTVQLKYPDGSLHTYGFNNDTIRFTPASSGTNNVATVDFNPAFLKQFNPDGDEYQLIVTGKDPQGNTAGTTPYRVSFKIITKAMISNMLNYPNPFTTSTAFVFTITGSDVPQNIKIQILTITGKIVREITKEELGPLHVGRNITEFKWNGTDMYGSRLANGVYLYHVVTNLNGKNLDKYHATGDNTDKFFNNGYGKMYLMR